MKKFKTKNQKNIFYIISDSLRIISNYIIVLFVISYTIGASGMIGKDIKSYPIVAMIFMLSLILLRLLNRIVYLKNLLPAEIFLSRSLVLAPLLSLICYYVINHQVYYFYIFILIGLTLFFTLFSFFARLKPIWDGVKLIKKDTVIHFVHLYVMTIFTFTFLYTLLQTLAPPTEPVFNISYPTDLFLDFFYFSVITVTTIGYGDINPVTPLAKILVTIQSAMGYLLLSIMLGLMIAWLDRRKKN